MTFLRCIVLLQLATTLALGQPVHHRDPAGLPKQPEALVRSLFMGVVARHPLGIPSGANREVFEPYLSKALVRKIKLARSCQDDWVRQSQGRMLTNQVPEKSPVAWAETGFFSGANELSEPLSFRIERTKLQKDGSFLVYVNLRGGAPPEKPWNWEVAVRVLKEDEYPVIDGVIYLKGQEVDIEYRLSQLLVEGCDGPRWVGFGDKRNDQKLQK